MLSATSLSDTSSRRPPRRLERVPVLRLLAVEGDAVVPVSLLRGTGVPVAAAVLPSAVPSRIRLRLRRRFLSPEASLEATGSFLRPRSEGSSILPTTLRPRSCVPLASITAAESACSSPSASDSAVFSGSVDADAAGAAASSALGSSAAGRSRFGSLGFHSARARSVTSVFCSTSGSASGPLLPQAVAQALFRRLRREQAPVSEPQVPPQEVAGPGLLRARGPPWQPALRAFCGCRGRSCPPP